MIITGTRVRGGKYYGGTASAVTTDTYFNLVTLLLPGNGTNGAQNNTFLDSSTNAFTVTRNGNTTQGTFSPFSQTGWSNYFDGSGDYLSTGLNAAFNFGSGAFTIEGWVNISSFPAGGATTYGLTTVYATGDSDVGSDVRVLISKGSTLGGYSDGVIFASNSTVIAQSGSFTFNANQWYHIAVTRSSNSIYIFIDGVLKSTTSYSSTLPTATTYGPSIGATLYRGSSLYNMTGYISNLRVLKGTAQYTATFTPPTSPLTNITNTSLLTCQSNRFIDNSTNAFAITPNGNTAVQAFSPFDPTAAYSAGTVGGSGYFDGTGDFLRVPSTTTPFTGITTFTYECWLYPISSLTTNCIFDISESQPMRFVLSSTQAFWQATGAGTTILTANYTWAINSWHHVVFVRDASNNISIFINGIRYATTVYTGDMGATGTGGVNIGCNRGDTWFFPGYISDARFVKGTAVYDPTQTTITVPTAPLTAIANTSLLLNYTNGGITDSTAKNVLETIADAQISTAQSKFGGSSIAFDGTGDYLMIPNSQNFVFGSGDFTIEFWLRLNANNSRQQIAYHGNAAGTNVPFLIELNTSFKLRFLTQTSGGQILVDSSATPSTNTWIHVACVRNGTSAYLFVDGVSQGTITPGTNALVTDPTPVYIGTGLSSPLNGYIDDFRVTKGYARYTANFTPPTTAFPTQ